MGQTLRWLQETRRCRPCEIGEGTERGYLATMAEGLDTSPWFREIYVRSYGLCLVHIDQAMRISRTPQAKVSIWRHLSTRFNSILSSECELVSQLQLFLFGSQRTAKPDGVDSALAGGCPGCRAEAQTEQSFLRNTSLSQATSTWSKLCPRHRELLGSASLRRLDEDRDSAHVLAQCAFSELEDAERIGDCLLCQQTRHAATDALMSGKHDVGQTGCLPHIRLALQEAASAQRQAWIESLESRLESLSQNLGELIRKHDYRFSSEPLGDEKGSWLQALSFFAGDLSAQKN